LMSLELERWSFSPAIYIIAVELHDGTEDVPFDPWQKWWYGNCITIILAYNWGASTSLKEEEM
jgi:hypothetical protein